MKNMVPLRAAAILATGCASAVACPTCQSAVAAQGPSAIQTVNTAILILLVPAALLFAGVFWFSFRFRNEAAETSEQPVCTEDAEP